MILWLEIKVGDISINSGLAQYRYRQLHIDVYIHRLVYTYVFPCCVSWESLEIMTPQKQNANLACRSDF